MVTKYARRPVVSGSRVHLLYTRLRLTAAVYETKGLRIDINNANQWLTAVSDRLRVRVRVRATRISIILRSIMYWLYSCRTQQ